MSNLNINNGDIRLTVNNDRNRVISFNPNDLGFVNNLYDLLSDLESKEKEYKKREAEIDKNTKRDCRGIPENLKEKLALLQETCSYMREQIDKVFGEGTSRKAFGNTNALDMFEQFFNGITPYIKKVRTPKIDKYTNNNKKNVMR